MDVGTCLIPLFTSVHPARNVKYNSIGFTAKKSVATIIFYCIQIGTIHTGHCGAKSDSQHMFAVPRTVWHERDCGDDVWREVEFCSRLIFFLSLAFFYF
jgi:hypothetical protein